MHFNGSSEQCIVNPFKNFYRTPVHSSSDTACLGGNLNQVDVTWRPSADTYLAYGHRGRIDGAASTRQGHYQLKSVAVPRPSNVGRKAARRMETAGFRHTVAQARYDCFNYFYGQTFLLENALVTVFQLDFMESNISKN